MRLMLDYATFNFDEGTRSSRDLSDLLAGGTDLMFRRAGMSDNAPLVSPFGLYWKENNGWAARPHRLDVSGIGCHKFAVTLPRLRDSEHQHFSRLDFAFDVPVSVYKWRNMLANAFETSLTIENRRKKYSLTGSGEAMTLYVGSRKCAKFFRVYNKTLEDKSYTYYDDDGNDVAVEDGYYIIRYEVELKRHKLKNFRGEYIFDPSSLFDLYYSDSEEDRAKLLDFIRSAWRDYLPAEYLPDLEALTLSKKLKFCSISEEDKPAVLQKVKDEIYVGAQSFDSTVRYVAERFGKYIPWILADDVLRERCFDDCMRWSGFSPDFEIREREPGWTDVDEDIDEEDEFPREWLSIVSDGQYQFDHSGVFI